MATDLPSLKHLAQPGAEIAVRVTPRAARNRILIDADGALRVYVTTVPEDGKATEAVRKILAKALGVPKTALILLRGTTSRDKVFRIDAPRGGQSMLDGVRL
ncbi:DUF167 domain-containing protein [Pseudooceanicola sediminis]|mgnify:CR=1 FL=1|uniref:UPF0235 protein DL237_17275 n=1 Tax=Pseudooceanicola sediminis TaxID=2211117 RepID=A0A399J0M9_9RHOB|nr:DUF167 domain-containing protein [Pseudooceanicola sediminis]KAA2312374.1 DUF167 domain-containing protein [Puniceibacterium sp. HSS470]RII37422.1 DUF167 domain-containing protein [Pseudooceanicola sediminis]|tara:strand:+ start:2399 stop:2704 length:306 start_codon:yes stop_codon:yes gene_type:complete